MNIQLSKWTADRIGAGTGYTLQFTHQGVQFGAVAFYGGGVLGEWSFATGFVDFDSAEVENATDAPGSFAPGTPALLSITFSKSLFPHADASDNALTAFRGGTADFKPPLPVWVAEGASGQDVPAEPDYLLCDLAESGASYVFQTGGHSTHDAGAQPAPSPEIDASATQVNATGDEAPAAQAAPAKNAVPMPGLALALAAVGLALAARRPR